MLGQFGGSGGVEGGQLSQSFHSLWSGCPEAGPRGLLLRLMGGDKGYLLRLEESRGGFHPTLSLTVCSVPGPVGKLRP